MKILITAGGTKEYIDGVRYIGNSSSGRTGSSLADYMSSLGHTVVWLGAESAIQPRAVETIHHFVDYDGLASKLKSVLSENHFDAIFQAAAVSDYKVESIGVDGSVMPVNRRDKINTQAQTLHLTLKKQPKLINQLHNWSINKELKIIGFKLTNMEDIDQQRQAAEKLLSQPGVTAVAHNDLHNIQQDQHPFSLYVRGRDAFACDDIKSVVNVLMTLWEMD